MPNSTESTSSLNFSSITRAGRAGALDVTFEPQLVEKRLHAFADLLHQFEIREQDEALP